MKCKFNFDKKVLNEGSIGSFTEPFFDYKVLPLSHTLEQKVKKHNMNKSEYFIQIGNFVKGKSKDDEKEYNGVVQKFLRDEYNDIQGVFILARENGKIVELVPETVRLSTPYAPPKVSKGKLNMGSMNIHNFMTNESIENTISKSFKGELSDNADSKFLDLSWEDFRKELMNKFDERDDVAVSFGMKMERGNPNSISIFQTRGIGASYKTFTGQISAYPLDQRRLEIQFRCGLPNHHSVYHIFYNNEKGYYLNTEIGRTTLFEESCPSNQSSVGLIMYIADKMFSSAYKLPRTKKECVSLIKRLLETWNLNHGYEF